MNNFSNQFRFRAIALVLFLFAGLSASQLTAADAGTNPNGVQCEQADELVKGCSARDAIRAALNNPDVAKCLNNAPGSPYKISFNAVPLTPCPQGQGNSWQVIISAEIPCINPPFCPLAPVILVAIIVVDCNCNVTSVSCGV